MKNIYIALLCAFCMMLGVASANETNFGVTMPNANPNLEQNDGSIARRLAERGLLPLEEPPAGTPHYIPLPAEKIQSPQPFGDAAPSQGPVVPVSPKNK